MSEKTILSFWDTPQAAAALTTWTQTHGLSKSEVLRLFLREGLERRGFWPAVTANGQAIESGGLGVREHGANN